MARAPFQVLILPYLTTSEGMIEYAVFKRSDAGYWQFLSGGGECGETPIIAAAREAYEEASIPLESNFFKLDSMAMVPANAFKGHESWGKDVYVIPEHCFAVEVSSRNFSLSAEHIEHKWGDCLTVSRLLKWDSNRNALWELNQRLIVT